MTRKPNSTKQRARGWHIFLGAELLVVTLLSACPETTTRANPAGTPFDAAGVLPSSDAGIVDAGSGDVTLADAADVDGMTLDAASQDATPPPVPGFADMHLHQMSEYAYAGAWYWGSHTGDEATAMQACSGGDILGGDHARTKLGPLNEFLGQIPGTQGDTGLHFGKKNGYPSYDGWPRWDTIAHQTVPADKLLAAHQGGLNLYLTSAVNFEPLCDTMPEANRVPGYGCDDMQAVDRQITAAWRFAADHDWVEIARSPAEARRIIGQGKLAMVLSVEITELFTTGDWQAQLDAYYDLGVRSIQFAHQLNNRFAGVAPHHWIFKFFELLNRGAPFELDEEGHNTMGLTDDGKALARAFMDRGMIVDIAHLSERGIGELALISAQRGFYPINVSHGHLRSIMREDKQDEEKTVPDDIALIVRQTGGMFGLRSGPEGVRSYPRSGVANDCDGSSKSFAQAYAYATQGLGLNVAFASDFNGFIQQLRPRFGGADETCGAALSDDEKIRQQALQTQRSGTALDTDGFGHIGLEPAVRDELAAFGLDVSALDQSAEHVLQMWERCLDPQRTGPLSTDGFDTTGIESNP